MLKGKASPIRSRRQQVSPVQPTGLPPTPGKEWDRGPRSWCHHRALVMSGTQAPVNPCRSPAERPYFSEASHNPAKGSAPILPARLHVGAIHTHTWRAGDTQQMTSCSPCQGQVLDQPKHGRYCAGVLRLHSLGSKPSPHPLGHVHI